MTTHAGHIAEVYRLAASGWSHTEIARILTRRGSPVSHDTVSAWLDENPEPRLEAKRRSMARINARLSGGRLRREVRGPALDAGS